MATLNPDGLYAKTAKGREELARRSNGLPLAVRSVLILLDGKVPLRDLLRRYASIPTFRDDLEQLLDQGFIAEEQVQVSARERLIELADQLLAGHASAVVLRLKKSGDSNDDLLACIENCSKLIRLTIDEKKAEQFREAGRRIVAGLP